MTLQHAARKSRGRERYKNKGLINRIKTIQHKGETNINEINVSYSNFAMRVNTL